MDRTQKPPVRDQLDRVSELLTDGLEDEDHHPADRAVVEQVVRETAADFDGVPVKDFVPVLTERRARIALGSKGLKRRRSI